MKALRVIKKVFDELLHSFSLLLLLLMVVFIIVQVFSRQFLSHTPAWSSELSKVFFVWISFLGIGYGFKEKLHIALGLFVNAMPQPIQTACDVLAKLLTIGFGFIMIFYGWRFTALMHNSTMPGTGLPSSVLYVVVPITGLYVLVYGIELLFIKGMHLTFDETEEGE